MNEQLALLPGLLAAHLRLTLAALVAGTLIAVPAGVLISRSRRLEGPLLGFASVVQTVPALALLAVMVPLLAAMGLPGIGYLPAFLGLTLYCLLPILRNTVTGLRGVDPAVLEAADGVGLTGSQRLRLIELPLALPVLLAGLRTATVWTVGMATLSTPVGAPSLGNYIFGGLQTRNLSAVLVGCLASAALALLLDALVRALAEGSSRRRRGLTWTGALGLLALSLFALAGLVPRSGEGGRERPVRIGAKTFTEQYVLAEILAGQVRRTGARVEVLASLGSTVAFDALARGEIDAYVDYTGTLWATLLHRTGTGGGRAAVLAEVGAWLERTHGVRLLCTLGFENTYAFALKRTRAAALGLRRLSDFGPQAARLRAGADYEFWNRSEWADVRRVYGIDFAERRAMDPSLMYAAIGADQVDVITAYSTDARIASYDLVTLEDDRGAIPPYDAVLLVGRRLQAEQPAVVAALARLKGALDLERMRALNRAVDEERLAPAAAAARFLAARE